jgi:hypothetical protein
MGEAWVPIRVLIPLAVCYLVSPPEDRTIAISVKQGQSEAGHRRRAAPLGGGGDGNARGVGRKEWRGKRGRHGVQPGSCLVVVLIWERLSFSFCQAGVREEPYWYGEGE